MTIFVGKIVGCRGIKGELKVKPQTSNPERFNPGNKLLIDQKEFEIEASFKDKNLIILKLKGIDDRNAAEKLRDKDLEIYDKDLMKLKEGEYFVFDLVGFDVVEGGEKKGVLKDIIVDVYPNDIYLVQSEKGEVLLPAVKSTIKKIDPEKKIIEVVNFEEYE